MVRVIRRPLLQAESGDIPPPSSAGAVARSENDTGVFTAARKSEIAKEPEPAKEQAPKGEPKEESKEDPKEELKQEQKVEPSTPPGPNIPALTDGGTFNSSELRSWTSPRLHDHKYIPFTTPFPTPPRILLGLNFLDIDRSHNLRTNVSADEIHKDTFHLHAQSWADTIVYSVGCDWLALDQSLFKNHHFESGTFNTTEDHPWQCPQLKTQRKIEFKQAYTSPPTLVVWLTSVDVDSVNRHNQRVHVKASNITCTGFTLHVDAWADTVLYSAGVAWLAYPKDTKGIASGEFFGKPGETGLVAFGEGRFGKKPRRVVMALTMFDADWRWNFRLKVLCDAVTRERVAWRVETWADTRVYQAGGAFVALE